MGSGKRRSVINTLADGSLKAGQTVAVDCAPAEGQDGPFDNNDAFKAAVPYWAPS